MSESDALSPMVVIAGNGDFPRALIEEAKSRGIKVSAICHLGETDPSIVEIVESFIWIKVGQLGKILTFLKASGAASAVFTGGISRVKLFKNMQPDLKGLAVIARVGTIRDDTFLRSVAAEVEKIGVRVIASGEILGRCIVKKGLLTRRDLDSTEIDNGRIGWLASKKLGELDLGQTAVVSKGLVVALECVEGTDEAILRGGVLSSKEASTVIKTAKPQQDLRLDLPSIGLKTLETMAVSGARSLILEHERAMMLEPERFIEAANRHSIAVRVIQDISELKG